MSGLCASETREGGGLSHCSVQGLSGREATAAGPESADDLGEKESAFTYGNQSRCKKDMFNITFFHLHITKTFANS